MTTATSRLCNLLHHRAGARPSALSRTAVRPTAQRSHYSYNGPGTYQAQHEQHWCDRDFAERSFTVGIGGPVGSGKTALVKALCGKLPSPVAVVTNDIFTKEDADFLVASNALPASHILAVETGGCPHAAIREDVSANLSALESLTASTKAPLLLCESGGDNLAANFSHELADYTVYVIDVAGGDKVPRKGGPGITQSNILCINKIDLADAVGASLAVMESDALKMRGPDAPTIFMSVKEDTGVDEVVNLVLENLKKAMATKKT